MKDIFIYTETTCARIANICIDSFHNKHDRKLHVITTPQIFSDLTPNKNNILIDVSKDTVLSENFLKGVEGVSYCYGKVLSKELTQCDRIIHFDSDVYFKKDCISPLVGGLDDGFDIMATRRCYKNNPGKAKVPNVQDVVSTYLLALNLEKFKGYDSSTISGMYRGSINPLGHETLDTFDVISFTMLKNGAEMGYLNFNMFGGQDENGKKINRYKSNLHMDCGSHLVHFAGIESGYNYLHGKSPHPASYGDWAIGRYALFEKLFYNENITCSKPTQYGADGRWINGNYDDNILNQLKKDLKKIN